MKLLTVGAVRDRWEPGSISPDLPVGVDYCGQYDPKTDTYLVVVPDAAVVSAKAGRTALSTPRQKSDALTARNLSEATVNIWRVG